ncbi:PREDICTED: probable oligoribonuclease [Wasmannia auropunctata]|uniref:probable oligoribonuclease n=1 Tax=Wasmannia auropunctata TaxID=64793 RepID=UPI0005ED739C|nr:PREDICTED: probable oligoribonuclease [Wasmannia auropunctata]XP_011686140.1 PREDICTED: probable oligoribonuclease [Wasmannia auropunctata]
MILARATGLLSRYLHRGARRYLNNDHATSTLAETRSEGKNEKHIVWLDMEMTGLEVETCRILEVACFVTDEQLELASDCLNIVIHQSDEVLKSMNDWCKLQHRKTGLIDECRLSTTTLEEAQQRTLNFLENHVPRGACPLAGNTVYMDRLFLKKYMPLVDNYLHYRIIDISTIKALARRWHPDISKAAPKKQHSHRAVHDIKDSLNELRYYRKNLFVS